MTSTGPPPAGPAVPAETKSPTPLAEAPLELQHPVLRRLHRGGSVGDGVRQGAAWASGAKVGAQLIQFLGIIITARLLTPADYGLSAIVLPIAAFALIFTSLGLGSAVIHHRRVTEQLLSTAFFVNCTAGLLMTGLVAGLSVPLALLFDQPELTPLFLVASLNFAFGISIVHTALLERTLRFKQIATLELTCTVISIGTVVVAALAGAGALSIILGPLSYTIARTTLMWSVVRWFPRALPTRESLRDLWTHSRGVTGFNILLFWSRNADNLLLARFVTQAQLGNYSRAYNLMMIPVQQIQVLTGRVLFPALTRLRDDRPRMARAWLRAVSVTGLITAPIAIGMAVAAPAVVEVLFGPRWLGMVTVLQLLAVSALPQTLTSTVAGLLRATGATDELFRLGLVVAGLSLVAMLVGLPWGTVGVATALAVKFYAEVLIFARPCLRETEFGWLDLVRALRGVWLGCLTLAATGLAIRFALSDALPAWQVLLLQLAACGTAYVATVALVDRQLVREVLQLVRGRRADIPQHA